MSFREKLAWAMSVVLIIASAYYAGDVLGQGLALEAVPPPSIELAIIYIVLVVIGATVGAASVALQNTEEANAPADERERIILDKAGNWSGYVLGACAVMGVLYYWTHRGGNVMFHFVVAGLMLSQIAEYVFQIILFRRGV